MNIQVAIQNTMAQFPGVELVSVGAQGSIWTIRIKREDMELLFEIDARVGVPCVLERKNMGYRSMSRFMNAFVEEVELLVENDPSDDDDDPMNY